MLGGKVLKANLMLLMLLQLRIEKKENKPKLKTVRICIQGCRIWGVLGAPLSEKFQWKYGKRIQEKETHSPR